MCQIIQAAEVIVVGSQSILGTYREDELPDAATMSMEVDVLPIAADNEETARLADLIEGVAGELSPFDQLHGQPYFTGWCLDKEDLCVAKLCAQREKDQNFVGALLDEGLVDRAVIAARLTSLPARFAASAQRAAQWFAARA